MLSALVLFLEDDLGQHLARDVFAGAGVAHFELDALFDHVAQMIERHVARCLGIVEAAVRVFFYDDRTGRPAVWFAQAGSSIARPKVDLVGLDNTDAAPLSRVFLQRSIFGLRPIGCRGMNMPDQT